MPNSLHKDPVRVLHILHSLGIGGAESWLRHLLRYRNREKYKIDVMIHEERLGYSEEIRNLGGDIFLCPYSSNPLIYGKNFKNVLRREGPFDIVHSHMGMGGFHAWWAYQAGVPVRIVHSHTDDRELKNAGLQKKIGVIISKQLMYRYASAGIAVSRIASQRFGKKFSSDDRWQVLYCGIDLTRYEIRGRAQQLRLDLGIPMDSLVVGHVGRFNLPKNHNFLLDIFKKIIQLEPKAMLLLIGDGELRFKIKNKTKFLGLEKNIIFTGVRKDVEKIMTGVMDVFLLPSLYEGLPLVLLEAQAAGLPCIISENISEETDVIKPAIIRISLDKAPAYWAKLVIETIKTKGGLTQKESIKIMEKSKFNIKASSARIFELYDKLMLEAR
jgi:glycosyltransferase involved in cell wall biosynthesis